MLALGAGIVPWYNVLPSQNTSICARGVLGFDDGNKVLPERVGRARPDARRGRGPRRASASRASAEAVMRCDVRWVKTTGTPTNLRAKSGITPTSEPESVHAHSDGAPRPKPSPSLPVRHLPALFVLVLVAAVVLIILVRQSRCILPVVVFIILLVFCSYHSTSLETHTLVSPHALSLFHLLIQVRITRSRPCNTRPSCISTFVTRSRHL